MRVSEEAVQKALHMYVNSSHANKTLWQNIQDRLKTLHSKPVRTPEENRSLEKTIVARNSVLKYVENIVIMRQHKAAAAVQGQGQVAVKVEPGVGGATSAGQLSQAGSGVELNQEIKQEANEEKHEAKVPVSEAMSVAMKQIAKKVRYFEFSLFLC